MIMRQLCLKSQSRLADSECMDNSLTLEKQMLAKLRATPIMLELSDEKMLAFRKLGNFERYLKDAQILQQHRPSPVMHIILSGRVKVSLSAPDGKELALNYLDAPAHFGEMGLPDSEPSSVNVTAMTDVELFSVEVGNLVEAIQINPKFALSLITSLSRRLHQTIALLEDMVFQDATHRVMRVILNIATACCESKGFPAVEGVTHYEISLLAGTSRETASRVISSLAKEGVVATKGRKIVVDIVRLSERLERN